jgi:hypothetical protein
MTYAQFFLKTVTLYHSTMLVIALAVLGVVLDIRRKITRKEETREKDSRQLALFAGHGGVHAEP